MSNSTQNLGRKIDTAAELQSVVRTMKALAASNIGQYEASVKGLGDYYAAVQLGLGACFRDNALTGVTEPPQIRTKQAMIGAVVFGSDQGLVGQFDDVVADYATTRLATMSAKALVWAVGERVRSRLVNSGLAITGTFAVPNTVAAITSLVGQIQIESEAHRERGEFAELWLFHNHPTSGSQYAPIGQRLLPLDARWQAEMVKTGWPTSNLPEVIGDPVLTLRALVREFLFISLFRACAESLASENASRLAMMQRADKNITDLQEQLHAKFHQMRQNGIDEELFDVISGFEAQSTPR